MAGSAHDTDHDHDSVRHENHGNSVAAWSAVVIITVGFMVGCFAVIAAMVWLFWVSVGICVVGIIAGKVLALLGFGMHSGAASTADVS